MHDCQAVRQLPGFFQVMGGEHDRGSRRQQLADQQPRAVAALRVQPRGGLIQEQDLRTAQDRHGEIETVPLTARKGSHRDPRAVPEADQAQRFGNRPGRTECPGPHPAGLRHGQIRREPTLLQHDSHPAPDQAALLVGVTAQQREELSAAHRERDPPDRIKALAARAAVAPPQVLTVITPLSSMPSTGS